MPTQNVKNLIKDKLNAIPLLYHITQIYISFLFNLKVRYFIIPYLYLTLFDTKITYNLIINTKKNIL